MTKFEIDPTRSDDEDEDSVASSGDEMLSMVAFSQESANNSIGRKKEVIKTTTTTTTEESPSSLEESPAAMSALALAAAAAGEKRTLDKINKESGVSATSDLEANASRLAAMPLLSQKIGTPSKLFWHEQTKKRNKIINPCRVCPNEEIVGLAIRSWTPGKEHPVQYVQYPHPFRNHVGIYDKASIRSLIPFHGDTTTTTTTNGNYDDNNENRKWCPKRMELYLKQLKKGNKQFGALEARTEELYLERVLEKSIMEEKEERERDLLDTVVEDDVTAAAVADEAAGDDAVVDGKGEQSQYQANYDSEDDDNDDDDDANTNTNNKQRKRPRRRCSTSPTTHKIEPLRPGDIIAFYKPPFGAGDPNGYTEATILSIDPHAEKRGAGNSILTVDEFFVNLQKDHLVKRIKRKLRNGMLVDHPDGCFRAIDKYDLKKEGDPNGQKTVINQRTEETSEILQRNKHILKKKLEDVGGPMDVIR